MSAPQQHLRTDDGHKRIAAFGFALPTVLIASIVMLAVLVVAVQSTATVSNAMKAQAFSKLAQTAADSGIAYAKACLKANGGVPLWTDAKPLRPNTNCAGTAISGQLAFVLNTDEKRTSFEVGAYNEGASLSSIGTTELLRASNGAVWRSYAQSRSEFLRARPLITNFVFNPSGDTDTSNIHSMGSAPTTATIDTARAYSGAGSLKVTGNAGNGRRWQMDDLSYGTQFTWSAYVYSTQAMSLRGYGETKSDTGAYQSMSGASTDIPANVWTRMTWTAASKQAIGQEIGLGFLINGTGTGQSVWVDNVMVTAGPGVSSYADGSAPNWTWNGVANKSSSMGPPLIINLVLNPTGDTTATNVNSMGSVPTTATVDTARKYEGNASIKVTGDSGQGRKWEIDNLAFGTQFTWSAYVYSSQVVSLRGYGETKSPTDAYQSMSGASTDIPANVWTRMTWTAASQQAADKPIGLGFLITSGGTGRTIWVDNVMVTPGESVYAYADGDTPNWGWSGAVNNSSSSGPLP